MSDAFEVGYAAIVDFCGRRIPDDLRDHTLEWTRSDGRSYAHEGRGRAQDLRALLDEIDADPYGVFWG